MPASREHSEALYLAAQEALVNVARHSGAALVVVRLGSDDAQYLLTVTDDGRGFAAGGGGSFGHGLRGARERMEALGGGMTLDAPPGGGTEVRCACPRPEALRRQGGEARG